MLPQALAALPTWLVVGVGLGAAASLLVAGAFVVGRRLFPAGSPDRGRRVDGENRRRAEIREYLRAIDEPFAEGHPVEGVAVDFFLPGRSVAITFDAQAYFRLRAADVHVILAEHEMPASHLSRRLPFDVPEVEAEPAVDVPDPVAAAFDRLGVPRSADPGQVKTAYRDRVKEVHPDQGGDEAEFRRVREAYATARNHAERTE